MLLLPRNPKVTWLDKNTSVRCASNETKRDGVKKDEEADLNSFRETIITLQKDIDALRNDSSVLRNQEEEAINSYDNQIGYLKEHFGSLESRFLFFEESVRRCFPPPPAAYVATAINGSHSPTGMQNMNRQTANGPKIHPIVVQTSSKNASVNSNAHTDGSATEPEIPKSPNSDIVMVTHGEKGDMNTAVKTVNSKLDNPIPTRVSSRTVTEIKDRPLSRYGSNGTWYIGKKVNFDKCQYTVPPRFYKQQTNVKNCNGRYNSPFLPVPTPECNDTSNFSRHVKKRIKSYFISDLETSITKKKIVENYITENGLSVKYVSITLSRRQNDIIRVGLQDNGNADDILCDNFFPPGVICKRWRRSRRTNDRIRPTSWDDDRSYDDDLNNHIRSRNASGEVD
ncbi:hypothetical protein ACF0H5_015474 [Mactra antiquata]